MNKIVEILIFVFCFVLKYNFNFIEINKKTINVFFSSESNFNRIILRHDTSFEIFQIDCLNAFCYNCEN